MTARSQPDRGTPCASQRSARFGTLPAGRRLSALVLLTPVVAICGACGPSIDPPTTQAAASSTASSSTAAAEATEATPDSSPTTEAPSSSTSDPVPGAAPTSSTALASGGANELFPPEVENAAAESGSGARAPEQLTVLWDRAGEGRTVRSADCVAMKVGLEVAETGAPVGDSDDPMVVASDDPHVIPGLLQGTDDMRVGGSRRLLIPSELAYGSSGWGDGAIQPGDSLRADVSITWAGDAPTWSAEEVSEAVGSGAGHLDLGEADRSTTGETLTADGHGMALVASVDLESGSVIKSGWRSCKAQPLDLTATRPADWFADEVVGMRTGDSRMVLAQGHESDAEAAPTGWIITLVSVDG